MPPSASELLLSALPDPVLLVDAGGLVTYANPAAAELFGARIRLAPLRAHLRHPEVATLFADMQRGATEASATIERAGATAETVWRVTARRIDTDTISVSLRDITDLAAAEAQRRDFVANVSHELRSPLTVLAGFIETLQGPAVDDPQARAEFLAIMARETARMTGLVADLLSLSRVEGSERIRPRETVSLADVLRSTLAALRPQVEAAGVVVTCDLPADLAHVSGDHDQLVQVYHNLVENSLKYGASGGRVDIRAQCESAFPGFDGPVVRVSVRDHGDGIDPVHIPRLTERFYRVDPARSRETGGTGLGLAIVKHILGRHRGRLIVNSRPGEGACFQTLLPCQPAARQETVTFEGYDSSSEGKTS